MLRIKCQEIEMDNKQKLSGTKGSLKEVYKLTVGIEQQGTSTVRSKGRQGNKHGKQYKK